MGSCDWNNTCSASIRSTAKSPRNTLVGAGRLQSGLACHLASDDRARSSQAASDLAERSDYNGYR